MKVTFEQRLEGSKIVSSGDIRKKSVPGRRNNTGKGSEAVLCMTEGGHCECFTGSISANPSNPYEAHFTHEEIELQEGSLLHESTQL